MKKIKKVKSPKTRKGRGVLFVIASIFFVSAVTRILDGGGELFAKEIESLTQNQEPQTAAEPQVASQEYSQEQLKALIHDLRDREKAVEEKEIAIKNRMQALNVAEVTFTQNLQRLQDAEVKLRSTMALASTAAEDDLARLTSVYENMKPKDAAALFEEMAPEFSAGFLGRMRPEAAASVMAGLTPNTAYSISVILAGRNAAVPTE